MATIDSRLLSMEEDTLNANQVKDLVIERLYKDKLISYEQSMLYAENWQVIVIKANWFTRWSEKFGIKNNSYKYKLVNFEA